jgi:hypothetical protein
VSVDLKGRPNCKCGKPVVYAVRKNKVYFSTTCTTCQEKKRAKKLGLSWDEFKKQKNAKVRENRIKAKGSASVSKNIDKDKLIEAFSCLGGFLGMEVNKPKEKKYSNLTAMQSGNIGERLAMNYFEMHGYSVLEPDNWNHKDYDFAIEKDMQLQLVQVKTTLDGTNHSCSKKHPETGKYHFNEKGAHIYVFISLNKRMACVIPAKDVAGRANISFANSDHLVNDFWV